MKTKSVPVMFKSVSKADIAYESLLEEVDSKPKVVTPVTFGCDPELMIFDLELNRMASALRVLPGNDKHNPLDLGDGIKLYSDNVLCELAVPPSTTVVDLVAVLRIALQRAQKQLGPRYRLVAKTAHEYDPEEMADDKAWEAGCSPNFDAYAGTKNMPPQFKSTLRTGSFHIHLGIPSLKTELQKRVAVRAMDLYVGIASIVFDTDPTSPLRRSLYGHPGEWRPTPYGLEYRVLGNYVLRSPVLTELALNLAAYVARTFETSTTNSVERNILNYFKPDQIQQAIQNCNREVAMSILGGLVMPSTAGFAQVVEPCSPDLYRDWKLTV